MEKNNLVYIFLLLMCISLLVYSGHLFKSRADLDQSQHVGLIKQGSEYILRLDITNDALIDSNYTISVFIDKKRYDENILVRAGRIFKYEHHIYPPLENKWVNVMVYREDGPDPISENTYLIE